MLLLLHDDAVRELLADPAPGVALHLRRLWQHDLHEDAEQQRLLVVQLVRRQVVGQRHKGEVGAVESTVVCEGDLGVVERDLEPRHDLYVFERRHSDE